MGFHTANYHVYVALGDPKATPLWKWKAWQQFFPVIDPLIHAARGKPAVRSTQFLAKLAGDVKFGRLAWKEADHQKWCHGSPTNKNSSRSWRFLSTEVWAPAWAACEREDLAPDLFFSISDESLGGGQGKGLLFNPVVILAIVSELAKRHPTELDIAVSAMREVTLAKLLAYKRRPWGKSVGSDGFTNSIQDLASSGLFQPGPRHKGEIGLHLFADKWKEVLAEGVPQPSVPPRCVLRGF